HYSAGQAACARALAASGAGPRRRAVLGGHAVPDLRRRRPRSRSRGRAHEAAPRGNAVTGGGVARVWLDRRAPIGVRPLRAAGRVQVRERRGRERVERAEVRRAIAVARRVGGRARRIPRLAGTAHGRAGPARAASVQRLDARADRRSRWPGIRQRTTNRRRAAGLYEGLGAGLEELL